MICLTATLRTRRIRTLILAAFVLCLLPGLRGEDKGGSIPTQDSPARLRPDIQNTTAQAGWKYDAYPDLQSLDNRKTITLAYIKGPAQINTIHTTQMRPYDETARSVILEIYFDGRESPAVSVPLGDFFADGTGLATNFSTLFVEKTPAAYNCYIPMPFKESARVTLRNESDRDLGNYSYVEWQTLPNWDASLGYFHASWQRIPFQLTPETTKTMFRLTGPGQLVGAYWNINTDEPTFRGFNFVMEGNTEHRVDAEKEPSVNYLGSEDSFNFSWGWHKIFTGYKVGINYLTGFNYEGHRNSDLGKQNRLSVYRFRDRDVIRFKRSLELTINWTKELRGDPAFLNSLRERAGQGGAWVDYAVTTYWYSPDPAGLGLVMPPLGDRIKPLLHENPPWRRK